MPKYIGFNPAANSSVSIITTSDSTLLYLPFDSSVTADSSPENVTVTSYGQAILDTSNKAVGASSLALSETSGSDYLTFPTMALTGDFTIEGFFRTTIAQTGSSPGTRQSLFTYSIYNDVTDSYAGLAFWLQGDGTLRLYASSGGNTWDVANNQLWGNLTVNTFHHFALSREGTTLRTYFDGTRTLELSNPGSFHTSAATSALGSRDTNGAYGFNGQIDDFRIVEFALYTGASLTVPTFPVTSTFPVVSNIDKKELSSVWDNKQYFKLRKLGKLDNAKLQSSPDHRWNPANVSGTSATGGSIVTPGNGYKYHVFTSPGTFELSAIDGGSASLAVEYLVVGGGGGGAANRAGGGGAGGFRTNETGNPKAGSAMALTTGSYPVVVGTGGSGGDFVSGTITFGDNGTVSSFNSIESAGGGTSRSSGGSGGGGHSASPYAAGSGNTPPVSPSQGNPGGDGHYPHGGGGGGGAGAAGNAGNPNAGNGGNGYAVPSFSGPILSPAIPSAMATAIGPTGLYAGGGGGGASGAGPGIAGAGGSGGGGNGGNASVPPGSINPSSGEYGPAGAPGIDGTGGGGGGGGNAPGNNPWIQPAGDGGNGIVIIRYLE